jgi:mono/diheme cytochrome c family protein
MSRSNAPARQHGAAPTHSRVLSAVLAAAATAAFVLPAAASAQALDRGRALYETRCVACHERSVHQRTSRRAPDFAALRREVERWAGTAGGEWKTEEIDQVTVYLNDRYYKYPCPPTVCREPARADIARPGS